MEWQELTISDMDQLNSLANQIHIDLHERSEVFAEKVALFPDGCRKVVWKESIVAHGIAHPWEMYSIPPLNTFLSRIPINADCLYIHDVVVSPTTRGNNLAGRFVQYIKHLAQQLNLSHLALVSVYGTSTFWSRFGFQEYQGDALQAKLASYGPTAKYMTCDTAVPV